MEYIKGRILGLIRSEGGGGGGELGASKGQILPFELYL